jgi:DNA-binding NtrC family response regulator
VAQRPILVVDDDPGIRQMLELALTSHGHVVEGVSSVGEAIDAAARLRPALVLLDSLLGADHGSSFAAAAHRPGMAIILMTASENAASTAERMGADGYLEKPFDLEAIYAFARRFAEPEA